jgi:hypothetical protein
MAKQAKVHDYEKPQNWSAESADFINSLLIRKQSLRLGNEKPGSAKTHPWFHNFDWADFESQKMVSPFAGIVNKFFNFLQRKLMRMKIVSIRDRLLIVSLMKKKLLS